MRTCTPLFVNKESAHIEADHILLVKFILSTWSSVTLTLHFFGLAVDFFALNKWHEAARAGAFDNNCF